MSRRVVYTRSGTPADILTVVEEPESAAPQAGPQLGSDAQQPRAW